MTQMLKEHFFEWELVETVGEWKTKKIIHAHSFDLSNKCYINNPVMSLSPVSLKTIIILDM
jgi:hypothetical protein